MREDIDYAQECIFCKDLSVHQLTFLEKDNNGNYIEKIIDRENIILYESDNFVVIPDIAPLVLGHVLIVTKSHYIAMTEFKNTMVNELKEVINYVDFVLGQFFSKRVIHFEHGPGKNSLKTLRSINHFHLHCLCLNVNLHSVIKGNIKCDYRKLNDYTELQKYANVDYLFGESYNNKYIYNLDDTSKHSQVLRELLFNYIKSQRTYCLLDKYNWKMGFNPESYFESKRILLKVFGG